MDIILNLTKKENDETKKKTKLCQNKQYKKE